MKGRVRAPATTANLGPGFDCAAAAFELWNEVEVTDAATQPPDPNHLAIRAFARLAPIGGLAFAFTDRFLTPARARLQRRNRGARAGALLAGASPTGRSRRASAST